MGRRPSDSDQFQDDLEAVVTLAKAGDMNAYETIVRRFQGMAVSYAYGILGDFHLAQDAAQEAFVSAYSDLKDLRASEAFVSWFRRVVFKHCDRLTRGKQIPTVPLPEAKWVSSDRISAEETILGMERAEIVRTAISKLSDAERSVMALSYFSGYPEQEVAAVLAIPVSTVKNRLRSARQKLRERLLTIMEETAQGYPEPIDNEFSDKVVGRVVRLQQTVPFLWVSDMDRAIHFYVDGLGFKMIRKWEKDGKLRWCWLQHGGAALMIQVDHDDSPISSTRGEGITLYFICESAEAVYNQAIERGIAASDIEIGNGMKYTNIADPDGYSLCFESPTTEPPSE